MCVSHGAMANYNLYRVFTQSRQTPPLYEKSVYVGFGQLAGLQAILRNVRFSRYLQFRSYAHHRDPGAGPQR